MPRNKKTPKRFAAPGDIRKALHKVERSVKNAIPVMARPVKNAIAMPAILFKDLKKSANAVADKVVPIMARPVNVVSSIPALVMNKKQGRPKKVNKKAKAKAAPVAPGKKICGKGKGKNIMSKKEIVDALKKAGKTFPANAAKSVLCDILNGNKSHHVGKRGRPKKVKVVMLEKPVKKAPRMIVPKKVEPVKKAPRMIVPRKAATPKNVNPAFGGPKKEKVSPALKKLSPKLMKQAKKVVKKSISEEKKQKKKSRTPSGSTDPGLRAAIKAGQADILSYYAGANESEYPLEYLEEDVVNMYVEGDIVLKPTDLKKFIQSVKKARKVRKSVDSIVQTIYEAYTKEMKKKRKEVDEPAAIKRIATGLKGEHAGDAKAMAELRQAYPGKSDAVIFESMAKDLFYGLRGMIGDARA